MNRTRPADGGRNLRSTTLNKTDLIDHAARQAGTSKAVVGAVLDACIAGITQEVAGGGDVTLTGFGTFEAHKREARAGRNPLTGDKIKIPAKVVPRFRAGAPFKAAVAGGKKKGKK